MYNEKEVDKNMNIRQEAKPIIFKAILKWPNLETEDEETNVNLKRGSNLYQYNVVDNFHWTLTNMFFEDFMKIGLYQKSMQ